LHEVGAGERGQQKHGAARHGKARDADSNSGGLDVAHLRPWIFLKAK
jgi:hypothetical protein